jgi:hypothetical protein
MAIFFKSRPSQLLLSSAIEDALITTPPKPADVKQEAATRLVKVTTQMKPQLIWPRLGVAIALLVALVAGGLYASAHQLDTWNTAFIHSFELVFGLVVGLLGGEASASN